MACPTFSSAAMEIREKTCGDRIPKLSLSSCGKLFRFKREEKTLGFAPYNTFGKAKNIFQKVVRQQILTYLLVVLAPGRRCFKQLYKIEHVAPRIDVYRRRLVSRYMVRLENGQHDPNKTPMLCMPQDNGRVLINSPEMKPFT